MKIGLGEGIPLNVTCDWDCADEGESNRATLASQVEGTKVHSFKLTWVDVERTDGEVMRPDISGIYNSLLDTGGRDKVLT